MNNMNAGDRDMLVRLETKLDGLLVSIGEVKGMLTTHDGRLRAVEIGQSKTDSIIEVLRGEIEKLRASGNWKDAILGIGVLIGTIISIVLGNQVW